jgi:neuroblastoma-amplified sequence
LVSLLLFSKNVVNFVIILQIFVESLLCSGSVKNINLAGRMLECSAATAQNSNMPALKGKDGPPDKDLDLDMVSWESRVSYDRAVELVISASREYFDASATMDDPDMELAR